MNIEELKILSKRIRKQIIQMADYCGGDAHWGGALSCADMLAVLFGNYLNVVDRNLAYAEKDKFILSKGQSAIALYSVLSECGIMEKEYLSSFQQDGSALGELAIMDERRGIECSGGSLGLGLAMGVGLAIAAKKKNYKYKTIVMVGDGECNEGSVWEAVMLANQMKLDNLTLIVDLNGLQSDGATEDIINNYDIKGRFEAFGWKAEIINGHNLEECLESLNNNEKGSPKVIIMQTIKGKGISFMENNNDWHHKILEKKWLEMARKEVGL